MPRWTRLHLARVWSKSWMPRRTRLRTRILLESGLGRDTFRCLAGVTRYCSELREKVGMCVQGIVCLSNKHCFNCLGVPFCLLKRTKSQTQKMICVCKVKLCTIHFLVTKRTTLLLRTPVALLLWLSTAPHQILLVLSHQSSLPAEKNQMILHQLLHSPLHSLSTSSTQHL